MQKYMRCIFGYMAQEIMEEEDGGKWCDENCEKRKEEIGAESRNVLCYKRLTGILDKKKSDPGEDPRIAILMNRFNLNLTD